MKYRKLTKDDTTLWDELARPHFLPEDFYHAEKVLENWDLLDAYVLLTESDEWIGVIFLDYRKHDINPNGIHFLQVFVRPEFQGQGYSNQLMEIGLKYSLGMIKSVCINPNNIASIALFEKYGFKKSHPLKTWDVYLKND
ncbi:MAG: GNAT family N-acetyltransferase [Firmicutes bacterium]|nr:GNAT family N-acetyltransferase [Bacillota bacterium]